MTEDREHVIRKLDAVRRDLLHSMAEHDVEAHEALALLTSMLTQVYCGFVENPSREHFTDALGESYDTYVLLNAEPQGSIQ